MTGKRVFLSYRQDSRVVREWTPAEVTISFFSIRVEPTSPQEQYLIHERLRNVGYRTISKALVRTTLGCRMHYFYLRRSSQQRTNADSDKVENISLRRVLQIYEVHRGEFWNRIAMEYSAQGGPDGATLEALVFEGHAGTSTASSGRAEQTEEPVVARRSNIHDVLNSEG